MLTRAAERFLDGVKVFKVQELANTAWAFATAGQSKASLFRALAKAAEPRVGDFGMQNLINTAWAFATVAQPNAWARVAEQWIHVFDAQDLRVALWAVSRCESLKHAWVLLDREKYVGHSFSLLYFG